MREFDEFEPSLGKPPSELAEVRRVGAQSGWRGWLAACAIKYTYKGFAPHHVEFWEWVWSIEDAVRPEPTAHINIWSRSHAKSTSAELAVAMLCARGRRKYVVYVCRTQDQADQHVANIGGILESQAIADVYPTVGQRLVNDYGHAKGWKRSQLRSAAGFSVEAYGLDSAQRGAKIDQYRPDLIIFDDVDDPKDTEVAVQKNIEVLTKGLLPTGSRWMCVMGVQNLISDYGIFGRMVSGEADFLKDRHLSGPIPAIENLEVDIQPNERGENHHAVLGGEPTWEGYSLADAQADIDTYGFSAFDVEFQHNTGGIGFMFPPDKWIELDEMPLCRRYVRAWDFAGTDKRRSDWTVGVKMGRLNGKLYVLDVIRRRVLSGDLRDLVLATARADGKRCRIVIPKDPGQAGGYQAIDFGKGLMGYSVFPEPQTGSKTTKAEPFSGSQQLGMVYVPKGAPWLPTWKYEYDQFPNGRWDDQCLSGTTRVLTPGGFRRLDQVGAGDRVMGASGWVDVEWAGQTGISEVVENCGLIGTAGHPIWTNNRGWVRLSEVSTDDMLLTWNARSKDAPDRPLVAAGVACTTHAGALAGRWVTLARRVRSRLSEFARWRVADEAASSCGECVTCTTAAGATRGASMSDGPCREPWRSKSSSSTASASVDTRMLARCLIVATSSLVERMLSAASSRSTRRFGSIIAGQFRRGSTFITSTRITATTTSPTSSFCPLDPTLDFTTLEESQLRTPSALTSPTSGPSLPSGIVRQRAASGTVSMPFGWLAVPVFNLRTSDGTFYANDVLVHNCDAGSSAANRLATIGEGNTGFSGRNRN